MVIGDKVWDMRYDNKRKQEFDIFIASNATNFSQIDLSCFSHQN